MQVDGNITRITGKDIRCMIRAVVGEIGEDELGFTKDEVGTHSNRSAAAMAMYLENVPVYTIMLVGRWSSDAFVRPLRRLRGAEMLPPIPGSRMRRAPSLRGDVDDVPRDARLDGLLDGTEVISVRTVRPPSRPIPSRRDGRRRRARRRTRANRRSGRPRGPESGEGSGAVARHARSGGGGGDDDDDGAATPGSSAASLREDGLSLPLTPTLLVPPSSVIEVSLVFGYTHTSGKPHGENTSESMSVVAPVEAVCVAAAGGVPPEKRTDTFHADAPSPSSSSAPPP
mmetsp:Transcript_46267/g.140204  ORF Transcript_46267/g.140204 Transcript_46267/m.140204 type:complete len:285 (+) Transcript_46267:74-928(+)